MAILVLFTSILVSSPMGAEVEGAAMVIQAPKSVFVVPCSKLAEEDHAWCAAQDPCFRRVHTRAMRFANEAEGPVLHLFGNRQQRLDGDLHRIGDLGVGFAFLRIYLNGIVLPAATSPAPFRQDLADAAALPSSPSPTVEEARNSLHRYSDALADMQKTIELNLVQDKGYFCLGD